MIGKKSRHQPDADGSGESGETGGASNATNVSDAGESPKNITSALEQNTAVASQPMVELLRNLTDQQREALAGYLVEEVRTEQSFSGPLPLPEHFAEYERILPGAAERILAMPEKEQQIRADGQA